MTMAPLLIIGLTSKGLGSGASDAEGSGAPSSHALVQPGIKLQDPMHRHSEREVKGECSKSIFSWIQSQRLHFGSLMSVRAYGVHGPN